MSNIIISVKPSDNIFRELGNNTYDFVELLCEFIDNSIAAKPYSEMLKVCIEIGYSKNNEKAEYIKITDNGLGISRNKLPKAISPAELSGGKTLNEHGLGMKQAIAALGQLEYLRTKTVDDPLEYEVNEFKFGDIEVNTKRSNYKSGTSIKISNLKMPINITPQYYTTNISVNLGAIYRRYLKRDNKIMNLTLKLNNLDKNQEGELIDKEGYTWEVNAIKPIYFHPNNWINEPIVVNKKFTGREWEAKLTFGYSPNDYQYENLGIKKPKRYMPYYVSTNKQGLDIIRNDRVIKMHQLSEIELVNTKHPKYNYIRGEIDLIKGFTTAITKNNIIRDENFNELIIKIKEYLNRENLLEEKTYSTKLPEALLRDRLASHFKTAVLEKKEDVQTEYAIEGLGGYIDILADNEVWEIKTGVASGLDIYQLFAYMDMGDFKKGYLLAKDFKTGAKVAADFINKNHNKIIELVPIDQLPILDAPTKEEIEKYY